MYLYILPYPRRSSSPRFIASKAAKSYGTIRLGCGKAVEKVVENPPLAVES